METISIIIPVYNVERYLDRCVQSVLQQSYENLEVILVDDGSPDNSGAICDRWAEKDRRIRVIHKKNGGLSDARNKGIDASCGEYIAFVDSDDYLAPDMIEQLYSALKNNNADMSICNFYFVDELGTIIDHRDNPSPITAGIFTGFEMIHKMTGKNGWFLHPAWNKLYKRSLFYDIRYPTNVVCGEDAFVVHKLFGKCSSIACIENRGYYYTQRAGSITFCRSQKAILNDAESFLDRAIYCYAKGLCDDAARFYWIAVIILPEVYTTPRLEPSLQDELRKTIHLFRNNRQISASFSLKRKAQSALILRSPRLYRLLFWNPAYQAVKEAFGSRTV